MKHDAIRMIIIDDIKLIVEGIANRIPWQEHGITISATAMNGSDGLEKITQFKPHIVITDIRMPKINGLTMIARALEHVPNIKIIIISGYPDFEYAQQALKLGAYDYITKPFTFEQLEEIVLRAKEEIEKDEAKELQFYELESKVRESLPALRQEYMQFLIRYSTSEKKVRAKWEFLEVNLALDQLAVMVVEMDDFETKYSSRSAAEVELIRFSSLNILEETVQASTTGIVIKEQMSRFIIVFNEKDRDATVLLAEACRRNIEQFAKHVTVSIGVGNTVNQIEKLPESYQNALQALSQNFFVGGNSVFFYEEMADQSESYPIISLEMEQELLYSVRSGNQTRAKASLQEIYRTISANQPLPEPDHIYLIYSELTFTIIRTLLEKFAQEEVEHLNKQTIDKLSQSRHSHKELYALLENLCIEACKKISETQHHKYHAAVMRVIEMIRGNLHESWTLDDCSRHVHLSSSYFANVFKKVTGLSFYQYLTKERMEKAAKLLMEDHQVQEVAASVGYGDRRYFSDAFKKHTGMTPTDFKNKYYPNSSDV